MLNVLMLSVAILNVVMLNVIMLSVVSPSVMQNVLFIGTLEVVSFNQFFCQKILLISLSFLLSIKKKKSSMFSPPKFNFEMGKFEGRNSKPQTL